MANVQFGLEVPCDGLDKARRHLYMEDVDRLLNYVKGHYDSAWVIDHLQFGDGDVLEGWTTLAYLSALHPELQWGHTVLCQSFRNPALVAKMGATLQLMLGGRFTLGIGAGWNEEEYTAYGYDFRPAMVGVEQLEEALQIMRALWTEEQATVEGTHYRVIGARCKSRPDPLRPTSSQIAPSAPSRYRFASTHAARLGEPTSSSPSPRTVMVHAYSPCTAFSASSAASRATNSPLSSFTPPAYSRASHFVASNGGGLPPPERFRRLDVVAVEQHRPVGLPAPRVPQHHRVLGRRRHAGRTRFWQESTPVEYRVIAAVAMVSALGGGGAQRPGVGKGESTSRWRDGGSSGGSRVVRGTTASTG